MVVRRYRVGVRIPLRFTATWPLVGFQFDTQGFAFRGPFLRIFVSNTIGLRHEWGDISRLKVSGHGVTLWFTDSSKSVKVTGLSRRRSENIAHAARMGGVTLL